MKNLGQLEESIKDRDHPTSPKNKLEKLFLWVKTPGFRKYSKNTSWLFFGKIASMAISFIATAYIARNLGPTSYGELSYAISFVSLFSFIAVLGIDQILYRELIRYPEKRNEYMGSALGLRLFTSTMAVILCIVSAFFISPHDVSLYLICIISLSFIFNSFHIVIYEFQADSQSKIPAILTVAATIILNILKIVVIAFDQGVLYLALILLFESILYAVGYIYFRKRAYASVMHWKFNWSISKQILSDSWPLIFSSAFALIYARIDQIMIKNMIGAESVGLYDAAVRLSEVWYFIPSILIGSLLPAIINAHKTSIDEYYSRIRKILLFMFLTSFITALLTYVFAPWIIWIVFGSSFIGAVALLQVYVWSNIATALNSFTLNYLIIENKKKTIFMSSFTGMVLNVILNIYLIPLYGSMGAAIATVVSYTVLFLYIFTVPGVSKIFKFR
jgi:O-antigen/teichoic acid export membrane protein